MKRNKKLGANAAGDARRSFSHHWNSVGRLWCSDGQATIFSCWRWKMRNTAGRKVCNGFFWMAETSWQQIADMLNRLIVWDSNTVIVRCHRDLLFDGSVGNKINCREENIQRCLVFSTFSVLLLYLSDRNCCPRDVQGSRLQSKRGSTIWENFSTLSRKSGLVLIKTVSGGKFYVRAFRNPKLPRIN